MKVALWVSDKGYERTVGPLIQAGAARHGDEIGFRPFADYAGPEADAGLIFGVVKREILWDHNRAGHPLIYVDKGYLRARALWRGDSLPAWWRVCINDTHPTAYLMKRGRLDDRLAASGAVLHPRRAGRRIVIAGSSQKFHHTCGLPHPTEWATAALAEIRRHTDAPVVYRPKPSWKDAEPIEGATFDHGAKTPFPVDDVGCVITYGSIASVDAIVAGVPVIVLGNAAARPIASTEISAVADPYWASDADRRQWMANLMYANWSPRELWDGTAWGVIKEQLVDAL